MAALQRTIALRPILAAAGPASRRVWAAPAFRSYSTEPKASPTPSDAPAGRPSESQMIRTEGAKEAVANHRPDYDVATDYRTSYFSPIPKRVMDGSEPGDSVPAAVLSGAPYDLQARTVRIYQPAKPATQSGTWRSHEWLMDWDPLSKGHRWENALMGWQSSADAMQSEKIRFRSKEDAISFANKQGYEYFVQEPNVRRFRPKAYANNFLYTSKKLKHIRTK